MPQDNRDNPEMVYLASPYSGPAEVQAERLAAVQERTRQLIAAGVVVFSPIAYSASLADRAEPPQGWYEFDLAFLSRCDRLEVLALPGWEESYGVNLELCRAQELKLPASFAYPEG